MTIIVSIIFIIYLYLSFKTRFISFTKIKESFKNKNGFKSLSILLGSSMGVGNIIGVGVAIYLAGPGVIFWMFMSAVFASATSYLEATSNQKSNQPISYIKNNKLSILYSLLMIITALFMGNMTQVNSIIMAFDFVDYKLVILGLLFGFIICTIKYVRVEKALSLILPFVTVFYLIGLFFLLFLFKDNLMDSIYLIFQCAFKPKSLIGIPFYYVFNQGILFAVFSNEAGNGSAALAFKDSDEKKSGIAALAPLIDTALFCVLTGLVIISSDLYHNFNYCNFNPNETIYMHEIFKEAFGQTGNIMMTSIIVLFAFATVLSWFYYAVIGVKYLKINYLFFYSIYLVLMVLSGLFDLTFLMEITNYLNVSLLFINLYYLVKGTLRKKIKRMES